jgi:hypothetical protein
MVGSNAGVCLRLVLFYEGGHLALPNVREPRCGQVGCRAWRSMGTMAYSQQIERNLALFSFGIALWGATLGSSVALGTSPEPYNNPEGALRESSLVARVKILSIRALPCRGADGYCSTVYEAQVTDLLKGPSQSTISFNYGGPEQAFPVSSEVLILAVDRLAETVCPHHVDVTDSETTARARCVKDAMYSVYSSPDSAGRIQKKEPEAKEWVVLKGVLSGESWYPQPGVLSTDSLVRRADGSVLWSELREYIRKIVGQQ